jgi:ABC-type multidrug transport system fused ATPase/permease subunit
MILAANSIPYSLTTFYQGSLIAVLMLITAITQTMFLHQYFHTTFSLSMKIRTALITAIYKKSMKLSNQSRQESTIGEITNLMSVDASKIADLSTSINLVWSGPMQICIATTLLYKTLGINNLIGPSVFIGILVMVLMIPINMQIARYSRTLQKTQMKNKDTRTKMMDEVISGIKVIKLYAWEKPFLEKILKIRGIELGNLKNIAYLQSATSFTWSVTPFLVSFTTFVGYSILSKTPLTSEKIFVSISLFNLLGFPLGI